MRRFLKIFLILILALLLLFLFGPRPQDKMEITFTSDSLTENLDAYISSRESNIPNMIEGAEKEIVWADEDLKQKTDLSIIYIHGFSATKEETRPLADIIAKTLHANLYYTRLTGHGQNGDEMAKAKLSDWLDDYAEAIAIGERLGEKIIILSASTGTSLATWGLSKPEFSEHVIGLASISANFELQGMSTALANIPWAESILPTLAGKERSWQAQNPEHEKWWTTRYPSKSIFPMMVLLKQLKIIDKSLIKTPALFIYSPQDKVIVTDEIDKFANEWGGPTEIMKINKSRSPSSHVLAGDILNPGNTEPIANKIIGWIRALE